MSGEAEEKGVTNKTTKTKRCPTCGAAWGWCDHTRAAASSSASAKLTEADIIASEETLDIVADKLLENREAQLVAMRDVVEQLQVISEYLRVITVQKAELLAFTLKQSLN